MPQDVLDELRKEIEMQKNLDHPNILRVFEMFVRGHGARAAADHNGAVHRRALGISFDVAP